MNVPAGGDFSADQAVELLKIDLCLSQRDHSHPAADIDPNDVRDDFIAQVRRETDDASSSRVYIRHDPDLTIAERLLRQQRVDLVQCCLFNVVSKYLQVRHNPHPREPK